MKIVAADLIRVYGRSGFIAFLKGILLKRICRPVITLRICQCAHPVIRPIFILLHHIATWMAGIELPWMTSIGGGFRLTHAWGTVIAKESTIGSDVTIFHGVTIGVVSRTGLCGHRSLKIMYG